MTTAAPEARRAAPRWPYAAAIGIGVTILAFWVYGPALRAPYLFDDTVLPFALPTADDPLSKWLIGPRPLLIFTYWLTTHFVAKGDSFLSHAFNVALHCLTSGLVYLIVRRLLEWSSAAASKVNLLAAFAAAVFLLHPVQTESVAYLAGRSEGLSVLLVYAAFGVYLYRRQRAATWPVVAAVLALFGLALLSKEHTVVLPALLLLTDYWWNPGFSFAGIRANWKLYLPVALGALGGVAYFWRLITTATTAGFALKEFTWYQYFFTQCRALFVYVRLFLFPVGLTADWDFPVSRTVTDHGAIVGLAGWLVLIAAAWHFRRRFPLASFGLFVYLILMAPTSSVVPIRDTLAERRLYLPMIGLLLILVDVLSRVKVQPRALAAGCGAAALILASAAHARAAVWSSPIALWEDTVRKSPNKSRGHFQLGLAYFDAGQYDRAVAEYQRTAELDPPTYDLLIDWGLALDKLDRMDDALSKFRQAAAISQTAHVYTQVAMVYGERQRWAEAMDALETAKKIDGSYPWIYVYYGKIHFKMQQCDLAVADYVHALQIQPALNEAQRDLAVVQRACAQPAH